MLDCDHEIIFERKQVCVRAWPECDTTGKRCFVYIFMAFLCIDSTFECVVCHSLWIYADSDFDECILYTLVQIYVYTMYVLSKTSCGSLNLMKF